jgi:hypothetical protein
MGAATVIITAAVVLALAVTGMNFWIMRKSEAAQQRTSAMARNARTEALEARKAREQVQAMLVAFRDGRPSEVDYRPTCPLDGEPLGYFHRAPGEPAKYVHADGSSHNDLTASVTTTPVGEQVRPYAEAALYTPSAIPPAFEQGQPPQASVAGAADLWRQRAQAGVEAGLIDPNKLITGISQITRAGWIPEPPPEPAEDATVADRVQRAGPATPGPVSENGTAP